MSRAALASLKLTVRVLRLNLSAVVPAKGEKRMTGTASTTMTIAEWARSPVAPWVSRGMAIAWMLDARASETCAVRSVSCPRAFSSVADVGFAVESGVFVGMRSAGDSGRSGEGSVVRLIILWTLSRVRTL